MRKFGLYSPPLSGDRSLSDAEATRQWARSLREHDLRELASEFKRGNTDPVNKDAWDEYCRRFPHELETPGTPTKKRK